MSKYLVHCDGCGMPTTVSDPNKFLCSNCGYELCTVDEVPEPKIGKECADLLEELWSGKFEQ